MLVGEAGAFWRHAHSHASEGDRSFVARRTIPRVKSTIVAGIFLTLAAVTVNAQQLASVTTASQKALQELVNGAQSLDQEDRIKVTKALAPDERTALTEALAAQFGPRKKIGQEESEEEIRDLVGNIRVRFIDLNGDGIPEVIAQASDDESCSPTGNCTIWVFMRSGHRYQLILERIATQTFSIRPTRTGGFNDLVLGQHGSAFERTLFLYRFINGRYRKDACYEASREKLVGDELKELKEPLIPPCNPVIAKKP